VLKPSIALEVRIVLGENLPLGTKTFCLCRRDESCPVCRGERDALPVINRDALAQACLLVRGLDGTIPEKAPFERNCRGSSVPEAALSRLSLLVGKDALLEIQFHRRKKLIRIQEIRLEEDEGRLIRSGGRAYWDYSDAGMPVVRILSAPDFEIGEETEVFLSELRRRIQYLELFSAREPAREPSGGGGRQNLESLIRCNAYAALAFYPDPPRSFVKLRNLNSFNFVPKAVNAELSRQEEILSQGNLVPGETRLWNEAKNTTEPFPAEGPGELPCFEVLETIPPLALEGTIPGSSLPQGVEVEVELPARRRERFMERYDLSLQQAEFLCDEKSRADYFEKTVALGASPRESAQWLSSFCIKEMRTLSLSLQDSPLSPRRFVSILQMLRERRIHGTIAKQLIAATLTEDRDPEELIRERGWEQITDRALLEEKVKQVIAGNPGEVKRIRAGDAGPIQFLTGLVMKETGGLAEPSLVKDILRKELSVSLVYVLSLGGAISGKVGEDGTVESGDEQVLRELLAKSSCRSSVRFEPIQLGRVLSEEIVPSDWAALIAAIAEKLNSGTANGIVIAHGMDTLPYTAPLLYWLFADAEAPIVLAASSTPPAAGSEAAWTMEKAIKLAISHRKGVYVVQGGRVLSPLNLKFEHLGNNGFRNWNMEGLVFSGTSLLAGGLEADKYVLAKLLEEAVNRMCVIRIYPGLRSDYLISLMERGVTNFFLELYDTGTAGLREGPYSLKKAFTLGKRRGARFYCTSQQESIVDFKGYATSRELWRSGAIPLGAYTTETAVARYLAASIIADSDAERAGLMESAPGDIPD